MYIYDDFKQYFPSCDLQAFGGLLAVIAFMVLIWFKQVLKVCDGVLILSVQIVCDTKRLWALGDYKTVAFHVFH